MENNDKNVIDVSKIIKKILERKRIFFIVLPIVFIVSCLIILCVPRFYSSEVTLAPELESASPGGGLSSIASSFGIDLGNMGNTDAIYPVMYPDLFESNKFIVDLFDIKVKTIDGEVNTDYYSYLRKHQKKNILKEPGKWVKRQLKKLASKPKRLSMGGGEGKVNPYMLNEEQDMVAQGIRSNIICHVDKKTEIISITVKDQDPLVCALMCDSVRVHLQNFITDYRTSKAKIDYEYYKKLADEAKRDYELATQRYSEYVDANRNMILQSYISRRDELENDMQLKFNTYTAMSTQMQASKAKVQERTPAFTILQEASVPLKPAGPKRMLFVLGMTILAFFITAFWIARKDLHFSF